VFAFGEEGEGAEAAVGFHGGVVEDGGAGPEGGVRADVDAADAHDAVLE
jgi:hypothetical protein